jgi:hypothetical protein
MVTYNDAGIFLDTCKSLEEKIIAIDLIIDALLLTAAKAAAGDNISEYSLNDGQTIIKTVYKSSASIQQSIKDFESLKVMYQNRLNRSSITKLVASRNIRFARYGR